MFNINGIIAKKMSNKYIFPNKRLVYPKEGLCERIFILWFSTVSDNGSAVRLWATSWTNIKNTEHTEKTKKPCFKQSANDLCDFSQCLFPSAHKSPSFYTAPWNYILPARMDIAQFTNHQIKPVRSLKFTQLNLFFNKSY